MAEITWHDTGTKRYETGLDRGVLYTTATRQYDTATAWNGLISVKENPSGAEANKIYADNTEYGSIVAAETFGATIEAYTYPEEFAKCDGSAELVEGVTVGQQNREMFGLSYRTLIGDDSKGIDRGYKIHLVYGCLAAPSGRDFSSINESPEAITLSWEISTNKVPVKGHKPTAILVVDSTKVDPNKLKKLEAVLYGRTEPTLGSVQAGPRLPLPDEVKTILA